MQRRLVYFNVQVNDSPSADSDHVDRVRAQWAARQPDLDTSPIAVIARLGRLHAYVDSGLHAVFRQHGLTRQSWDILASLARVGPPHRLTPTELHQALMRTAGAITHTLHRLEYAGLVERLPDEHDRRSLLVGLTPAGEALVARVAPLHLANERRMLDALGPEEQQVLAGLLRTLLISFENDQPVPDPVRSPAARSRVTEI